VISQSYEDQSPTPYIVEYAMAPEFKERYNNEEVNMGSFTGFIRTYLLADFDDSVRNMNDCSELPILVPVSSSGSCREEGMEDGSSDTNEGHGDPVDDGDTSGGGGTSGDGSGVGTGPSGNSSGSVTCNTSISTQSCSGCRCHVGTSTECTAGFKGSTTLTTSCSDGTVNVTEITIKNMRSSGCGPSGNMAIIPVPYKSLERVLNLTDSEADCLNENCDLKNQINQFVNQNEVTLNDPELAFANTVIDQLSDSCNMDFEVDFDEQIIFDEDDLIYEDGVKPLFEYEDKCEGIIAMWELSQGGNEFAGVITLNGAFLITQELDPTGGGLGGIYNLNGQTYYQYSIAEGAPSGVYPGVIESLGRYFIPISTTVHSHSPCVLDDTDGITNNIINDDMLFASRYPNASHFIIGCGAVGEFDGTSNQAFDIETGSIEELCTNIE